MIRPQELLRLLKLTLSRDDDKEEDVHRHPEEAIDDNSLLRIRKAKL